jgi:hypothetical protein
MTNTTIHFNQSPRASKWGFRPILFVADRHHVAA